MVAQAVGKRPDRHQRLGTQAIEYLLCLAPRFDDSGLAQHAELLTEQRLADPGDAFDLPDGQFLFADRENELQPHRMGKDSEQRDEPVVGVGLRAHGVSSPTAASAARR